MKTINSGRLFYVKKTFIVISLLLVLAFIFTSCGSSRKSADMSYPQAAQNNSGIADYDSVAPQEAPMPYPSSEAKAKDEAGFGGESEYTSQSTTSSNNVMSQRKMIMDGDVSLETQGFDDSIAALDQLVNDFGGFTEVRNVRGKSKNSYQLRTANYIIRVPAETFELVLKNMGTIGTVLESNAEGTDITDSYYDTQTRIKTLKVQEETLLDILSKSTKLEDVITLESRIAEVRYEIERHENTIRNYDRLVSFSRITIFIQEVDDKTETKPIPETLGERISGSFKGSVDDFKAGFEDFLVWLAGSWISIIFFLIIMAVLFGTYKASKRRAKKKAEKTAEKAAAINAEKKE